MKPDQPNTLEDFWEDAEAGEWQLEADLREEDDRQLLTRRTAVSGLAGILGISIAGSLSVLWGSSLARADVASGDLTIDGDSTATDGGQLSSVTVSADGHVSYDGLDSDADSININFFAAESGNNVDTSANRIAQRSLTVSNVSGLDTRAGHYDYSFTDIDVTNSDDLTLSDFTASSDGTSNSTDVDFRIELEVFDSGGTKLVEGAAVDTATVTVTNESETGNAEGTGNVTATGSNQSA